MRVVLAVEYDGTPFCGWQIQPAVPTVQASLESAVGKMASHPVRIHAAGRTDTGVHASQQIVHFDTDTERPLTAWVRGVNRFLPSTICVLWAKPVEASFHARYSALARHYRYILYNHPIRPVLFANKVGWLHQPVVIEPMQQAARYLVGTHDFSSFRAAECQALSAVRTLHHLSIYQQNSLVIFDFCANAFLHNMVRNIMGALLHIGKENMPATWMNTLLACRDRQHAPPTFMPDGLYLTGVSYPPEFALNSEPARRFAWC